MIDALKAAAKSVWRLRHESGEPYLIRYVLAGVDCLEHHDPGCKYHVFLHEIHTADSDRENHSHPWAKSYSLILQGGYIEQRFGLHTRHYGVGDVNQLALDDYHSIKSVQDGTTTLFIGGPAVADWGFLCDGIHVPHREYFKREGVHHMTHERLR